MASLTLQYYHLRAYSSNGASTQAGNRPAPRWYRLETLYAQKRRQGTHAPCLNPSDDASVSAVGRLASLPRRCIVAYYALLEGRSVTIGVITRIPRDAPSPPSLSGPRRPQPVEFLPSTDFGSHVSYPARLPAALQRSLTALLDRYANGISSTSIILISSVSTIGIAGIPLTPKLVIWISGKARPIPSPSTNGKFSLAAVAMGMQMFIPPASAEVVAAARSLGKMRSPRFLYSRSKRAWKNLRYLGS